DVGNLVAPWSAVLSAGRWQGRRNLSLSAPESDHNHGNGQHNHHGDNRPRNKIRASWRKSCSVWCRIACITNSVAIDVGLARVASRGAVVRRVRYPVTVAVGGAHLHRRTIRG